MPEEQEIEDVDIKELIKKEVKDRVNNVETRIRAEVNQIVNTVQGDMLKLWKKNKYMAIAFIGVFVLILLAGFFF